MPIIDLQRRQRELGRLRLGTKGPKGNPVKLDTWRLTSPTQSLLVNAADQWGGVIRPWNDQYELITKTDRIPVMVPPQDVERQQYLELWGEGGLQRRCDGVDCLLPDGELVSCLCDPAERECKPSTTLRFWLHTLPALGVWVLHSTGWAAASEIAGDVAMLAGKNFPVELCMEEREVKRPGQPTHRFTVPYLHTGISLSALLGGAATPASLPPSAAPALPPAPPRPPEPEPEPVTTTAAIIEGGEPFDEDPLFTGATPVPLAEWLNQGPPTCQTAREAHVQIDALFGALESEGHWKPTALPAALQKRGHTQVTDLRSKIEAVKFLNEAWAAAIKKVTPAAKPSGSPF